MREEAARELQAFLEEWKEPPGKNREIFLHLREYLSKKEGVTLDFIARPGVTYSLRAVHADQKEKALFVMVDVIEDVSRWLSVCFYSEMIADPEERGDQVPGGLLGEDAVCFDLEERDEALIRYVESRLDEACKNAAKE
ncbi:MAG: hypothetical protein KKD01_02005 [Proteobacteria bacterium]|nr:hypothetical protein [Pseudomonadota bacterium]MBU1137407.1 hypothetical protein [Pseudomonadota bacterium]MBU1234591.1 hypothetical protein [Pseudomonadota bacterium]MBU1420319.1 hypothetical protein [Pseudomonadota bacterium]MBU1453473.1 hypothetical protein [Pseudomonadota bacterium]